MVKWLPLTEVKASKTTEVIMEIVHELKEEHKGALAWRYESTDADLMIRYYGKPVLWGRWDETTGHISVEQQWEKEVTALMEDVTRRYHQGERFEQQLATETASERISRLDDDK